MVVLHAHVDRARELNKRSRVSLIGHHYNTQKYDMFVYISIIS